MPEGLIYEGVSEKPLHLSGGSAAQSTTYHAFDELLGIQHRPDSCKSEGFTIGLNAGLIAIENVYKGTHFFY